MRNHKFRAYDKKYKRMIFEGFHLFGEVMAFNQIEQYLFETKKIDGIPTIERWNDIEAMEFTGLKDMKGKEIYEGDLVKVYDPYTMSGLITPVIWDDNNCRYAMKNTFVDFDFLINDEIEVMGNIYENPELV